MYPNMNTFRRTLSKLAPQDHESDGDFLTRDFENPVDPTKTKLMYDEEFRNARIVKERVTMENGATYEVTQSLARKRSLDIGITATAAWLTHEQGLNRDRMLRAAKLGVDYVFVSPQQRLDSIGHFGRSVCNIIRINDYMGERHDRDVDHLWVDGISRGGMHGLGVMAKAPYLDNKKAIYSDIMVPCFPEGINLLRDIPRMVELLRNEAGATIEFTKLPLNSLITYPRTMAFHPRMLFQHLKEVPALLSGEVGDAARHMPDDTFAYVTNYMGDLMGQGSRWMPIFDQYDNVIVENNAGGGHLSIVAPSAQEGWQRRAEAVHEVLVNDPGIVDLGGYAMRAAIMQVDSRSFSPEPLAA